MIITANGDYPMHSFPGEFYIYAVSGEMDGARCALQWSPDGVTWNDFANAAFEGGAGSIIICAPSYFVRFHITGGGAPEFVALLSQAAVQYGVPGSGEGQAVALAGWTRKTASFHAVAGGRYGVDTNDTGIVATLPASPADGDQIEFCDVARFWNDTPFTIARNGSTINGEAEDVVCDVLMDHVTLVFGAGNGWVLLNR